MKLRGTTAGTPFGAKLTALCWAALTLLAPVAVSACTSSSPTAPTIISPTVTNSPTATGATSASSGTSASAGGTPGVSSGSASASSHAQPQVSTVTETVTASANSTNVPPAAPVTGGGGTAGFQGTLLLVLGAAAILAGAGGLVYRRWLGRGR
jgi:hypothetical protein